MGVENKEDVRNVIIKLWRERTSTPMDLLESLRGTEVAARNDYAGRVIFEFFQNAIDRAEKRIDIVLDIDPSGESARLIFANDGKPVTIKAEPEISGKAPVSDFHSLCAIFRSDKKPGETIGNKGVGFKSGWEFARRATIVSTLQGQEHWGFRLHQPLDLTALNSGSFWQELGEGADADRQLRDDVTHSLELLGKAPSFLFPEFVSDAERHFHDLEWATTVIVLDGIDGKDKISRLETLIKEFRSARLFFVHQLRNRNPQEITVTTRINKDGATDEKIQTTQPDGWTVISANEETLPGWLARRDELAAEARKLNFEIKEPSLAIAFPPLQNADETNNEKSLFFCYLPTRVSVPVQGGVHIHGDFLLDIARKHIADNSYNRGLLMDAARLLVRAVAENPAVCQRDDAACFLTRVSSENVTDFLAELETLLFNEHAAGQPLPWSIAYLRQAFDQNQLPCSETRHSNALQFVQSWCYQVYRERESTTSDRRKRRLNLLSKYALPLIPLSVEQGKVIERTYVCTEDGVNLFLRKREKPGDKALKDLDVFSVPHFSGMAISAWSHLNKYTAFGAKEFKFDQVIAAIRKVIREKFSELVPLDEQELGFDPVKLLSLIVALRLDVQNESSVRTGTPLQFLERKGTAPTVAQELAWLPLPVEGGKWLPAFRVLMPAALPTSDVAPKLREEVLSRKFSLLDISRLESLLANSTTAVERRVIAVEIGAWPCLPLDLDRPDGNIKLAFPIDIAKESYPVAREVWHALVKAWPDWSAIQLNNSARIKDVIDDLSGETPWFPLPVLNRCVPVPDVVLTKGAPVKAAFLYEYRAEGERESLLLTELGIRLPEELSPSRLIRQLKRMSDFSPPNDQLRGRYRTHMESLSKSGSIPHGAVPLLVSRDRHLVWRNQSDDYPLWFVGRDHVVWRNYFRTDADFLELRPDANAQWIRSLGVMPFEPTITPQGDELTPDGPLRKAISGILPYLILVAEYSRHGGTDTTTDKVFEHWQRLHFKKGADVSLLLKFAGIDKPVGKRRQASKSQRDVVYVEDKKEIWHDLENPTENLSAFAGVLSQALFRNVLLADPFEVCLSRNEAERSDWLQERYGVSEGQLGTIRERIAQYELSAEVLAGIVSALQPYLPAIDIGVLRTRWWDTSLYLENNLNCSPVDILACFPEVARTVCGDLDPTHHNLMEWRSTCKRYADDVIHAWLCEHVSYKPERVQELRAKLELADVSAFPPGSTINRYDFNPTVWLAKILRDQWSASIGQDESLEDWLARKRQDQIAWLRAGQLEKCAAQQIGGINWSVTGNDTSSPIQVGLMTPATENPDVKVFNTSPESRQKDEAGKQLRGETAEVFLVLETVTKLLNNSVISDQKRASLWDELQTNWQKIPFPDPAHKNALSTTMPLDPGVLLKELHLAKRLGDGLGFDIISCVGESGSEMLAMVEVKDIRSDRVFISENERWRAVQYAGMGIPWRMNAFINGVGPYDLTQLIVEQARLAGEKVKDLRMKPQLWVVHIAATPQA